MEPLYREPLYMEPLYREPLYREPLYREQDFAMMLLRFYQDLFYDFTRILQGFKTSEISNLQISLTEIANTNTKLKRMDST